MADKSIFKLHVKPQFTLINNNEKVYESTLLLFRQIHFLLRTVCNSMWQTVDLSRCCYQDTATPLTLSWSISFRNENQNLKHQSSEFETSIIGLLPWFWFIKWFQFGKIFNIFSISTLWWDLRKCGLHS